MTNRILLISLLTLSAVLLTAAPAGDSTIPEGYPVISQIQCGAQPVNFDDFRGQVIVIWFYSDFKS